MFFIIPISTAKLTIYPPGPFTSKAIAVVIESECDLVSTTYHKYALEDFRLKVVGGFYETDISDFAIDAATSLAKSEFAMGTVPGALPGSSHGWFSRDGENSKMSC